MTIGPDIAPDVEPPRLATLSPSRAADFKTCPLLYRFRSIDRLPDPLPLPGDMEEGDHLLIDGMGAYTRSLSTGFNGYGLGEVVTVARL